MKYYKLNPDHSVSPCESSSEWARNYEEDRRVAKDYIGEYLVSTVFLGLDHSFDNGPPMLFETMVFHGSEADVYCERCATWEEAEAQHARVCELTKKGDWT